jgi:RNA polymerase sigma-70 factor (ECF subfamily)
MDTDNEADADDEDDRTVISQSLVDPASFSILFDRYYEEIYRYLGRRVLSENAEDLAAECFVVVFRSRNTFDLAKRTARPWLYAVATNLLRNSQRRELHRLIITDRIVAERGCCAKSVIFISR